MRGYILTVNIEKAFDTLNQSTLPVCLKKIGIGMILQVESKYYSKAKNFVLLIQKLRRHTLIWKQVRAKVIQFLLIFLFYVLKFCFYLLKLIIKYKAWTFTQPAGDTAFFLKNKNFVIQVMETFSTFSQYFYLKPNYEKCAIAGIGALKSVKMAVCRMKFVDLFTDTIRITDVYFSYNKTKQDWKFLGKNNKKNSWKQ